MIIYLQDDISQNKNADINFIDIITQYPYPLLYCSVICDIYSLTEISKKFSLTENSYYESRI